MPYVSPARKCAEKDRRSFASCTLRLTEVRHGLFLLTTGIQPYITQEAANANKHDIAGGIAAAKFFPLTRLAHHTISTQVHGILFQGFGWGPYFAVQIKMAVMAGAPDMAQIGWYWTMQAGACRSQ